MRATVFRRACYLGALLVGAVLGCGTTRMTDTQRTATEQMLLSNAVDQAVSQLDIHALAGKSVFLDTQYLDGVVDKGYLISSLRQHLLANGCLLRDARNKATYVVEARSGGIGTDRHSLLVGIPQTTVPAILPGQPTQIPEIPFAKKTDQEGIAKIAVFAYNRETGRPLWQSGEVRAVSTAKDLWFLGTGPFQNGSLRKGTEFAGQPIVFLPFGNHSPDEPRLPQTIPLIRAVTWTEPASPQAEKDSLAGVRKPDARGDSDAVRTLMHSVPIDAKDSRLARSARQSAAEKKRAKADEEDKEELTSSTSAKPSSSPPANTGGQAETQPILILDSGFGSKPDK